MKDYQEKTCKNWFMRKSGKRWIFGCALVAFGLFMLEAGPVAADEVGSQAAGAQVTEVSQPAADQDLLGLAAKESAEADSAAAEAGVAAAADETAAAGSSAGEPAVSPAHESKPEALSDQAASPAAENAAATAPVVKSADEEQASPAVQPDSEKSAVSDNRVQPESAAPADRAADRSRQEGFKTNLDQAKGDQNGTWEVRSDGLYSDARGKGDSFLYSQSRGKDFVYSTDVTFLSKEGAAALIFRGNNNPDDKSSYAVNIDGGSNNVKFWRWQEGRDDQLINEKHIEPTADNKYQLKVVAIGSWISYYVNDVLVASSGDYTLQRDDKGQDTYLSEGYFGLLNWNSQLLFQNTFYKEITPETNPELEDITVSSARGTVEQKGQFTAPVTIQYVKYDAETVDLTIQAKNSKAKVQVTDAAGNSYSDFKNIPLAVGANYLTVTSTVTDADGQDVSVSYRLNVHRRQQDEVYYNELYRGQYHYSVKDGWANDPNGLVYYKGVYHFFYQFYDDTKWGPMHWAHVTSKDLIHWEEQPVAFYPDANGAMFSGTIVADSTNSSGLFDNDEGGLVALITADGNGQRIKLAYSKDEGRTWTKVDQIAADWSDDPLQSRDFRDPKVFRWEDKWFMVIAGGPLRIYSSDNLLNWQVESTYADLHTECPDLYPLLADDGSLKWVLSRGGRSYKVGDFRQVEGKWTFVPDADFENADQTMNFGKDSYAAMTYYVQDFGSKAKPTLPELIEVNWMNTWEDYCNLVADTVGQKFNGTFNLHLKLGLIKEDGSYRLTQTPIEAYKSLRQEDRAIILKDAAVAEGNDLLKDFSGDQYEIVSTFRSGETTKKVGFNLRVGDGEVTKVVYDLETETLSIDRSQSGIILSNKFAQVDSQSVKKNADGSIDLHIYVDRSSVEVFAKGDTVAGANQIFPAPSSLGVSVFAEGGAAQADIALYPLTSIWKDKLAATKALDLVQASPVVSNIYVGDTVDLKAYVMPAAVSQEVTWTVDSPDLVSVREEGNKLQVRALQRGTVKITAASKQDPSLSKVFTINITRNDFKTNIPDLTALSGKWYVDGESLYDQNTSANDYYMGKQKIPFSDYALDVDLKYQKGLINIFYASENVDPRNAYSIQFGDNDTIRLYRFMGETIAEGSMEGKHLNDGQFHHVRLIKGKDSVTVFVDGTEYLKHTFDAVDPYYNDAYVGLGLWDGGLEARNFYVTNLQTPAADKEALQQAVDSADGFDPSLYTEETAEAYQAALAAAKQILADAAAEQAAVDKAVQSLQAALAGLNLKPAHQVTPDEGVKDLVEEKPYLDIQTEDIPFKSLERENPDLEQGRRRVVTAGQNGQRRILVEVLGDSRRVVEDSVLLPAVDEVVEVGSKVPAAAGSLASEQPVRRLAQSERGSQADIRQPQLQTPPNAALPSTGSQEDQLLAMAGLALLGTGLLAGSRSKKED
ncbi:Sucrose-6-phosphate hydrolase [Streptococcus sp. DD11]|uniref:GH32 C-terminal domain-containing protein n=1 Tax=Streptococcus sp. DD11 TaxID=1777879 RepID=UPI00079A4C04|nr:GH32 C-terminal domain-containing protein [Streptococcus sp. DD11]KXT83612.1 Sucrose-6-phosphate hydrolase [Streptococcus sp. DD11]